MPVLVAGSQGWCNSSSTAGSLECVPSSIWQSGDHFNFVAGGSRYHTPVDGDLSSWTQDPAPFVDRGPFGDAGSQSFVPLPKLVEGTSLPAGGPTHMIAEGRSLRLGRYNETSELFTSSVPRIQTGADAGLLRAARPSSLLSWLCLPVSDWIGC
eukprot:SAG22_NODE_1954_length_3263_cov_1.817952_3_plen_154_part_00